MAYIPTYEREAREEGLQKGIEIGMEKGLEKGKLEGARALLANGVDIDLIVRSLGIPKEKIENHAPTPH